MGCGAWHGFFAETTRQSQPSHRRSTRSGGRECEVSSRARSPSTGISAWTTIWRDEEAVGFTDWDFAEPGSPLTDVAELAFFVIPMREPEFAAVPRAIDVRDALR